MGKEDLFTPGLRPDMEQEELIEYFKSRTTSGQDAINVEELSCLGLARLIVNELGGPEKAKIYWLEGGTGENVEAHAWVVKDDSTDKDEPYNNYLGIGIMKKVNATVGQLRREGEDITDEVLEEPWSRLG